MFLTAQDIEELTQWRRKLHRKPELSGEELETAREVCSFLAETGANRIITALGGTGVVAIYDGNETGPTLMFRAELDALPIEEISNLSYRSVTGGKAHLCGHDGHMAILAALARGLGRQAPQRGRVVLLFQPAEEDGSGAAAVLADAKFSEVAPDMVFALHNMPGIPFGTVALDAGPVNCASRGMRVVLTGKTAHASMPEFGVSPVNAVASLMPALRELGTGSPADQHFSMATVTHARIGEAAFGVAPAHGEIWTTLRTLTSAGMESLCVQAEQLVARIAGDHGLNVEISYHDIFRHCENALGAVAHLRAALEAEGIPHESGTLPMRASEDFGRFGEQAPAAMLFLGAGEQHPSLHNPDYDFPDELIVIGAGIFMRTVRNILG